MASRCLLVDFKIKFLTVKGHCHTFVFNIIRLVSTILRVNRMAFLFLADLFVFFLWPFLDWHTIKYNLIDVLPVGVADTITQLFFLNYKIIIWLSNCLGI